MFQEQLHGSFRIPLLDLATPTLRMLDVDQKKRLLHVVGKLINADWWSVKRNLCCKRYQIDVSIHIAAAVAVRYGSLDELRQEVALLVSMIAHTIRRQRFGRLRTGTNRAA